MSKNANRPALKWPAVKWPAVKLDNFISYLLNQRNNFEVENELDNKSIVLENNW